MKGYKTQCAVVLMMFASSISGCDFFRDNTDIVVGIPDIPEEMRHVAGEMRFDLVVGAETVAEDLAPRERVAVSVPVGEPSALRAYPSVPDLGGRLPPAGAVLRKPTEGRDLALKFETGVAATIVARLIYAGVPADAINIERLINEISDRAGERQWDINLEAVVDAFFKAEMHARLLEPVEGAGVVVASARGKWIRMDALRSEEVTADPEQGLVLSSLSPGTHVFAAEDSSQWLVVSVTCEGEAVYLLSPRSRLLLRGGAESHLTTKFTSLFGTTMVRTSSLPSRYP